MSVEAIFVKVSHPEELPGVFTVMFTVVVHVPLALLAANSISYVPGFEYVIDPGFCEEEVVGVTPPREVLSKFHDQLVGKPVDASVKITEPPAVIVLLLVFIAQVGGLF